MTRVVVRADAGPRIGGGHVLRCAALAEALRARGAEVEVLSQGLPPRVAAWLGGIGVSCAQLPAVWPDRADAAAAIAAARRDGSAARWVVVDGDHFDAAYMASLLEAGLRVAWIDDLQALGEYACDLVVNPTLGAERLDYRLGARSRCLAGATYALVRRACAGTTTVPAARADTIVVTLGNADPQKLTVAVMRAVRGAVPPTSRVIVIVGPTNPDVDRVRREADGLANVTVVHDPADLQELLAHAAMAVTAAGGTMWELARLGVPSLAIVAAENQQRGASAIAEAGAAEMLHLDDACGASGAAGRVSALWKDEARRARMATRARRLIDGRGAARVAQWIVDGPSPERIEMRRATPDDALQVWRINSDPAVRTQSFERGPIPIDGHFDWFDRRLASDSSRWYAFARGDEVAAQIRYDKVEGESAAELSFAVAAPFRGVGLGTRVLAESWRAAADALKVLTIRGLVIEGNVPSERAFRGAGFHDAGRDTRAGHACTVFERQVA